jgi:hypothetical protein
MMHVSEHWHPRRGGPRHNDDDGAAGPPIASVKGGGGNLKCGGNATCSCQRRGAGSECESESGGPPGRAERDSELDITVVTVTLDSEQPE